MRAAPTSDGRRVSVRPEDLERTAHWLRDRAEAVAANMFADAWPAGARRDDKLIFTA